METEVDGGSSIDSSGNVPDLIAETEAEAEAEAEAETDFYKRVAGAD